MTKKKSCSVPLCSTSAHNCNGISFHELPSNQIIREEWLKNISRADATNPKLNWVPKDRALVCSRHFLETDYDQNATQKRLKKGSIPTIFIEYPKYLQPKVTIARAPLKRVSSSEVNSRKTKRTKLTANLNFEKENSTTFNQENQLPSFEDNFGLLKSTPERSFNVRESSLKALEKRCSPISKAVKNEMLIAAFKRKLSILNTKIGFLKASNKLLTSDNEKKNKEILQLQQHQSSKRNDCIYTEAIKKITEDANNENVKALILLQQVEAYGRQRFRWSELCVRMCILWRFKSPRSYQFARSHLVNLPCYSTLQRYIGPSSLQTGLTELARLRIQEELKSLTDQEKLCSIIFDEMAIQSRLTYHKQADKIVGVADYGNKSGISGPLVANKLLCFVLKGLSTNYRIPVAYYLVKQLQSEDLSKLILDVLSELEGMGYFICRVVCDDAAINVKALSIICKGNLTHEIDHPIRSGHPLFISFDPCHVLKNIRSIFLDEERNLKINGEVISSKPIKILYENQRMLPIKPVRGLTKKTVYPTNFDKMNVARAMKIFSTELIAGLELCAANNTPGFRSMESTLTFMKNIKRWFEIHNICNRTHYIFSRNKDKEEFWMTDDKRLSWLEDDFLNYLESWRAYSLNQPNRKKGKTQFFLTKETYTALRLTTLSTVNCIKYLISNGLHFVLTRKFTSDDVEGLFSAVRASQGGNDQADATGSLYALERILKTGIFSANCYGNTALSSSDSVDFAFKNRNVTNSVMPDATIMKLNAQQKKLAQRLQNPPRMTSVTVRNAGIGMVAGFLLRLLKCKLSSTCAEAITSLIGTKSDNVNSLVFLQDRGGLMYPSEKFVSSISLILEILHLSCDYFEQEALVKSWVKTLLPVLPSTYMHCGCGSEEHSQLLKEIILKSVCKIFFTNISLNITDNISQPAKFNGFPLSRKVKKL